MAQQSYDTSNLPSVENGRVAIVSSKWYGDISQAMIAPCEKLLKAAGCMSVQKHVLPGCLEIPLSVRRLVQRDPSLEAVIVFGVILKGDTYHFDIVKDLCMSGLERVGFECDIPIINEILPVDSIEHAYKRAGDDDKNKGLEAGLAALEIIKWRRDNPLES